MKIQFWFEFASTYSYPAAARIGAIGEAAGVEIEWEPFLLGPIFRELGWKDSPFNLQPEKGRYMWRDLERLCEGYSLPFQRPSQFPRNSLLAARVACLGRGESWLPDFARAVYHASFADDRDIADPQRIGDILASLDLPADDVLARAEEDSNKSILKSQVERARERGVFGAPSFTVGDELFWGNDRLGDAIAWARLHPGQT
jgi:2-hydroxychromene-2-carboxylate isomerase